VTRPMTRLQAKAQAQRVQPMKSRWRNDEWPCVMRGCDRIAVVAVYTKDHSPVWFCGRCAKRIARVAQGSCPSPD